MATGWDEVGDRFTELGRTLRDRWSEHRDDEGRAADTRAADEVRGAVDGVRASLDDLADTITRTVNDPDVQDSARAAAGGLVEAINQSLGQLSDAIQSRADRVGRDDGPDGGTPR